MKKGINIGTLLLIIGLFQLWREIDQNILPQYLLLPIFIITVIILLMVYIITL